MPTAALALPTPSARNIGKHDDTRSKFLFTVESTAFRKRKTRQRQNNAEHK